MKTNLLVFFSPCLPLPILLKLLLRTSLPFDLKNDSRLEQNQSILQEEAEPNLETPYASHPSSHTPTVALPLSSV